MVVRSNNFGGRSVLDGSSTDHPDPKAYPKFDLSLPCDPDFEFEDANVDLQVSSLTDTRVSLRSLEPPGRRNAFLGASAHAARFSRSESKT